MSIGNYAGVRVCLDILRPGWRKQTRRADMPWCIHNNGHKINIYKVQIQDHHHPASAQVTAIKNDPGFRARQFAYPGRIAGARVALREARLSRRQFRGDMRTR